MVKDSTLYDRLEIPCDANESQIKKAFTNLSKKWHPDKHPDEMKEEADKKFKSIVEAKDVLLDTDKRRTYDQIGMDVFNTQQQPFNPFHHFNFNLNPFQNFQNPNVQLKPVHFTLNATIEQIYAQENVSFTYTYLTHCQKCDGDGGKLDTCKTCKGNGRSVVIQQMGNMMTQAIRECGDCNGKGKKVCEKCVCKNGQVDQSKTMSMTLSSSLLSGHVIQVKNEGNRFKQFVSDLMVTIHILPHPIFKRDNYHLMMNIELTLFEALFGFKKEVNYIDGSVMIIESTEKTNYNFVKCLQNKGINSQGNLYLIHTFGLPSLESEYKDIFKDILPHQPDKYEIDKKRIISFLT